MWSKLELFNIIFGSKVSISINMIKIIGLLAVAIMVDGRLFGVFAAVMAGILIVFLAIDCIMLYQKTKDKNNEN